MGPTSSEGEAEDAFGIGSDVGKVDNAEASKDDAGDAEFVASDSEDCVGDRLFTTLSILVCFFWLVFSIEYGRHEYFGGGFCGLKIVDRGRTEAERRERSDVYNIEE